jgi:hypothetical protein
MRVGKTSRVFGLANAVEARDITVITSPNGG